MSKLLVYELENAVEAEIIRIAAMNSEMNLKTLSMLFYFIFKCTHKAFNKGRQAFSKLF